MPRARTNAGRAAGHADDPLRLPLLALVDAGELPRTGAQPCPYLPDRQARSEGFSAAALASGTYQDLLDRGFRRSGRVFYRPRCPACRRCVPIRVPVAGFRPSGSQRRVARRNRDVTVAIGALRLNHEKADLYQRYLAARHPGSTQSNDPKELRRFLYERVVDSREILYRDGAGRLLAVSVVDVCAQAVSSVYHYFDPAERPRSIGVYSVLREIELARSWGVPHYYLGYWIEGCQTMHYKANYRPHELLLDGRWTTRGNGENGV